MENRPTKKQRELLSFIDGFIKGNGYGPSYREVMRALDYKSVSTVATHIDGLIARGWLIKKDNSARSLEVVSPGMNLHTGAQVNAGPSARDEIEKKIKQLRKQAAGDNLEAIQVLEKALEILGYDATDKNTLT